MTDDERLYRIALNAVPFIGPMIYHRLVAAFGSAGDVFRAQPDSLKGVEGVYENLARKIVQANPLKTAAREVELAQKTGVTIVLLGEECYPVPLRNAYSPPPVLYIKGKWEEADTVSIAVVGTRRPTAYGKLMAERLVEGLTKAGLTVVSGLARGVDAIAHRAAIAAGGRTVAALGCGVNIIYPPEHRELQESICGHGAVVSQFPFAAAPDKMNFPMRNRIISGLSLGTLVIEAAEKSGALITAYAAIDDNRDVFALPGPVNSQNSAGTNKLIKRGHAKLVQGVEDILDELPDYVRSAMASRQASLPLETEEKIEGEELMVIEAMGPEALHIDIISQMCGLPSNMVSAILLTLELKGKVKQMPGKLFIAG
ncbi:MAG: DNA-protecting protein DprA [Nitrospinae bacterium]|nr:DNA-protecting protein DprA [Nitrospinota bacterium]